MNDWQLDNPAWVKQRKKDWREYKFNIVKAGMHGWINLEKEQHKAVEQYFLTGSREALECLYTYFEDSLLLELWIHPSEDVKTLKQVFDRHFKEKPDYARYREPEIYSYTDRDELRSLCCYTKNIEFKGVSKLNGRDWLIDQVFMPQTMAAELALTHESDRADAIWRLFLGNCINFEVFLTRQKYLEYDIYQYKVSYWQEAIMLCPNEYFKKKSFEWMLEELDKVAANPVNYQPCQLKLAGEIEAVLADPAIPQALQERVTKLRAAN